MKGLIELMTDKDTPKFFPNLRDVYNDSTARRRAVVIECMALTTHGRLSSVNAEIVKNLMTDAGFSEREINVYFTQGPQSLLCMFDELSPKKEITSSHIPDSKLSSNFYLGYLSDEYLRVFNPYALTDENDPPTQPWGTTIRSRIVKETQCNIDYFNWIIQNGDTMLPESERKSNRDKCLALLVTRAFKNDPKIRSILASVISEALGHVYVSDSPDSKSLVDALIDSLEINFDKFRPEEVQHPSVRDLKSSEVCNEEKVFSHLLSKGFSEAQARGIMENILSECQAVAVPDSIEELYSEKTAKKY